jgi:putative SOS response-associated peptidase YedK
MCGRFALYYSREQLERVAGTTRWADAKDQEKRYHYQPRYNVAPQQTVPLLRTVSGERVLQPMRWAFPIRGRTFGKGESPPIVINVRAETALEKASFRSALDAGQRAVVIANGFYEWSAADASGEQQDVGKIKTMTKASRIPYFIYHGVTKSESKDHLALRNAHDMIDRPLFMAALFVEETEMNRFAIFTVAASDKIQWMHNRMPALLETEDQLQAWLGVEQVPARVAVHRCLRPTEQIVWHPVSNTVSSVKNEGPSLIEPRRDEPGKKPGLDIRSAFARGLKRSPSAQDLQAPETKQMRHTYQANR